MGTDNVIFLEVIEWLDETGKYPQAPQAWKSILLPILSVSPINQQW